MKIYGYVRTASFETQALRDEQYTALGKAGVATESIVEESGRFRTKIGSDLLRLSEALGSGDVLAVLSLDRLGGDLRQVITLLASMQRNGAFVRTLQNAVRLDSSGPQGKGVAALLIALEDFDKQTIVSGKRYGAHIARKRGHRGGKGKKMDRAKVMIASKAMSVQGTNVKALCESLGVVRQTLYRFIGPSGELREPALKLLANETD